MTDDDDTDAVTIPDKSLPVDLYSSARRDVTAHDTSRDWDYLRANVDTVCMYYVDDDRVWVCRYCNKRSRWKHSLKLHVLGVHLLVRKYSCDICRQTFKWNKDLRDHVKYNHASASVPQ